MKTEYERGLKMNMCNAYEEMLNGNRILSVMYGNEEILMKTKDSGNYAFWNETRINYFNILNEHAEYYEAVEKTKLEFPNYTDIWRRKILEGDEVEGPIANISRKDNQVKWAGNWYTLKKFYNTFEKVKGEE